MGKLDLFHGTFAVVVAAGLLLGAEVSKLHADKINASQIQVETYCSANLIMHTDLPAATARQKLEQIQATLSDSSAYWQRDLRGRIQCFIVEDLDRWSDDELPHPMARLLVGRVGGAAIVEQAGAGVHKRNAAYILASSKSGMAEHEIVHAYCGQAFGTTGPIWYREGMAQLLAFGCETKQGVNCPPKTLEQLKSTPHRTIQQVIRGDDSTRQLLRAFRQKATPHCDLVGLIPLAEWTSADVQSLKSLKESYAWNWLVCYLLNHNPNYQDRFNLLGQAYLARRENLFQQLFQPIMNELTFEYQFTLERLDSGYRTDLCYWDWSTHARPLNPGRSNHTSVSAARGYQASGIELSNGCRYRFRCRGKWNVNNSASATTADGDRQGQGRLEAVVMQGYQISQPFLLGESGQFLAPCSGHLYLRCRDSWNQLGDNSGRVLVTLTR